MAFTTTFQGNCLKITGSEFVQGSVFGVSRKVRGEEQKLDDGVWMNLMAFDSGKAFRSLVFSWARMRFRKVQSNCTGVKQNHWVHKHFEHVSDLGSNEWVSQTQERSPTLGKLDRQCCGNPNSARSLSIPHDLNTLPDMLFRVAARPQPERCSGTGQELKEMNLEHCPTRSTVNF